MEFILCIGRITAKASCKLGVTGPAVLPAVLYQVEGNQVLRHLADSNRTAPQLAAVLYCGNFYI